MNLHQLILTKNDCYKAGKKIAPKGIVVHSTGANNPNLRRYVNPDDGLLGRNTNANHWNQPKPGGRQICVHAFIGKLADGTIATYQTLPWDIRGWHSASGNRGAAHDTHIGFEICEDGLTDAAYFAAVYREAVELCAYLCEEYNLNPLEGGVIIGHYEGYARGLASNHADPRHWFGKHKKSMDTFRADVAQVMGRAGGAAKPMSATPAPATPAPAAPTVSTPAASPTSNEAAIWTFFKGVGLNDFATAGIMGNLYAESGLSPTNLQNTHEKSLGMTDAAYTTAVDAGTYANFVHDKAGYGLAQWTFHSRKKALEAFAKAAGASIGDLKTQLVFLWKEMQGYPAMMTALLAATSVREASDAFMLQFERPADQSEAARKRRAEYGQKYYDKYKTASQNSSLQPTATATPAAAFAPYVVMLGKGTSYHKGAGTAYAVAGTINLGGAYTIVEERDGFGRLKSGAGWVSLANAKKV